MASAEVPTSPGTVTSYIPAGDASAKVMYQHSKLIEWLVILIAIVVSFIFLMMMISASGLSSSGAGLSGSDHSHSNYDDCDD